MPCLGVFWIQRKGNQAGVGQAPLDVRNDAFLDGGITQIAPAHVIEEANRFVPSIH
jgi:hypothetical protein